VETGFLSVPRVRLLSLVRQSAPRAKRLARILGDMSRVLTTLLVGNNLASVLFSTAAAALGARLFYDMPAARSAWSLAAAVLMLFLGEYLPKLIFASRPLRRSLLAAQPYRVAAALLAVPVAAFSAFVRVVFRVRQPRSLRLGVSRDGLRMLVADRHDATRLTQFERRLIDRVLMLQATFAKDLMHAATEKDLAELKEYRRPGKAGHFCIPAMTHGDDILPLMRRNRSPVAVVCDEATGAELGVVTEEDVLLALTGTLKEG
jgi:putative hemolysin